MKIVLSIIILLFFSGCDRENKMPEYQLSRGEELVNSILANAAKKIYKEYNIRPCGVGVSMPGGPIKEVTLCFDTKKPYTKMQLRISLIKLAQELLEQINENNEIQEFLKERPFTIKNVEIIIYNHDEKGLTLKDPQISVAGIAQGVLDYSSIDPEDGFRYKNEYEETYEEALEIIEKS